MSDNSKKSCTEILINYKIDPVIFENIKNLQQLPDDVIINFLLAETSLSGTNFADRLSNEKK